MDTRRSLFLSDSCLVGVPNLSALGFMNNGYTAKPSMPNGIRVILLNLFLRK